MGINIGAMILYGLPYNELSKLLEVDTLDNLDELIYTGKLDHASPCYDSERQQWIVGVAMPNIMSNEFDFLKSSGEARLKFKKITGLTGEIIVSPNVY